MRILMIVPPERQDFYSYLQADKNNTYILLWHESRKQYVKSGEAISSFFKEVFFWDQFLTTHSLLRSIKPDRIVFFEIIDQRQIALLITANKRRIKTFYLEHGAAGDRETAKIRANEKDFFVKNKIQYLSKRFRSALGQMIKSKVFYYSATGQLSTINSFLKFCRLPFSMLFNTPNKALANCIFPERTPHRSIVFNRPIFEQFHLYTGIREDSAVFTGIPLFDKYYQSKESNEGHIVYIDQPCLEFNLLDWTRQHHQEIAHKLLQFANTRKIKMYVKLHPLSDLRLWEHIIEKDSYLQVIQKGDFIDLYLSSSLVLGYSSSLLTGLLCSQKNIVNLGWHPKPQIFGVDFSKTGLCHSSFSVDELETKFDFWMSHNLAKGNDPAYMEFLKEFNFPFDGRAGERVLEAITSDEIH